MSGAQHRRFRLRKAAAQLAVRRVADDQIERASELRRRLLHRHTFDTDLRRLSVERHAAPRHVGQFFLDLDTRHLHAVAGGKQHRQNAGTRAQIGRALAGTCRNEMRQLDRIGAETKFLRVLDQLQPLVLQVVDAFAQSTTS